MPWEPKRLGPRRLHDELYHVGQGGLTLGHAEVLGYQGEESKGHDLCHTLIRTRLSTEICTHVKGIAQNLSGCGTKLLAQLLVNLSRCLAIRDTQGAVLEHLGKLLSMGSILARKKGWGPHNPRNEQFRRFPRTRALPCSA